MSCRAWQASGARVRARSVMRRMGIPVVVIVLADAGKAPPGPRRGAGAERERVVLVVRERR
ncbi:hypothetical protein Pres01_43980 [Metapseudomonas resinovorans]|nr:hypothetical protein Pres01_43980 [Pseudomonas resinovorans]